MYISELFEKKKAVLSFEIFPPKLTSPIESIYETIEQLSLLAPDFISITYSAGGSGNSRTAELCKLVKEKYKIEPLAHLTCVNSCKKDIINEIEKLKNYGIKNILALRGDKNPQFNCSDFKYSSDLINFIMNNGNFNVSAACYPEGHIESVNLDDDIKNLKYKVDCGAKHLITQLFFDNEDYFNFKEKTDKAGIIVPIETGIMPLVKKQQVERMITLTGVKIPAKLSRILAKFSDDPKSLMEAGIAYATDQIIDLLSSGVRGIHLYVMNNPYVANKIYGNIKEILKGINA
jgi:methylenetetrahydrofolate reductase (NADPH)